MDELESTLESGLAQNPEAEIAEERLPSEIDPEEMARLAENLKLFKENQQKTISGSEAPEVDLSDFELDPELEHLYRRGRVEDTDEGPKWVAAEHQYLIVGGNYSGEHGKKKENGLYVRLDDMITAIVNGPEGIISIKEHGWRLTAIIPNGSGLGVAILERNIKRVLPDPKPVEKTTPVEEVHDEELQRMSAQSQEWAAGQQEQPSD